MTCALCAALQPMFCHLFSKTSGPFSPKLLQKSKTRKKEENVKNVLKNVEKVIQIQKKGHRLGCWGWETWLLICLGLPRAWKKIFFFTFFSDFGNLVRRNVQNIDFLEYFDDKSDVYSTNRAEILHAVIFWEDLQFKTLKHPKTKKKQKKQKGKRKQIEKSTSKKCTSHPCLRTFFWRYLPVSVGIFEIVHGAREARASSSL